MTEDEQETMLSTQPAKKSFKRVDNGRNELLKHLDPRLRKVLVHTKRIPKVCHLVPFVNILCFSSL